MKNTLAETSYCNYNHSSIQAVSQKLSDHSDGPLEITKRTFFYVRDTIVTGYGLYQTPASDVLKKGYGVCWGKSLLLIALLRANGIEAKFASIPVHRKFIKPLIGNLYHFVNSPYHHCVVFALVNNRWTLLDTILDQKTYDMFFEPKNVEWHIHWNGKDDCRLYTESVVGDPVIHDDIDFAINKKAGNVEFPAMISTKLFAYINKRIWNKTGFQETLVFA